MEVDHDDPGLSRLEHDPTFTGGWSGPVVRGFRKVMQAIRAAVDERDLYALKGLRFEKLQGQRRGQSSLRINGQWRLIVELRGKAPRKQMGVIEIADYH